LLNAYLPLMLAYVFAVLGLFINFTDSFFFFIYTPTTKIYTLSLHDALPILSNLQSFIASMTQKLTLSDISDESKNYPKVLTSARSEERFSRNAETDLVCRLLLEKKND